MSLAATTLSAAVAITDTSVLLASLTGVTAPNYQIGDPTKAISGGVTYLLIEQEIMKVTGLMGTVGAPVVRGELGSIVAAHGASAPVVAGLPADFAGFVPAVRTAVPQYPVQFQGFSAPVALAATITPSGPFFHVTGTGTALATINLPVGFVEGGEITIVFDGAATPWVATGNIAVAGTWTAAASLVTFIYDPGTSKWYPSRLA